MIFAIWKTMCMLAPWMLLGTAIAGMLHVFLPPNLLKRSLRGRAGVIKAVLLGVPLPLCSCGVIPTGIGLKKNGASNGASVGFLISTPQTGVDSVLVAASFLGWPFALFKVVAAAVTGLIGGWTADLIVKEPVDEKNPDLVQSKRRGIRDFFQHTHEILHSIWFWLIIGVLVSAAITEWVPETAFETINTWGLLPALLLVLLISTPLYVCATASVPIAAALVQSGMPPAVALVFLMAGPATNIATITSVFGEFGFKTTMVYLLTIILGSIGFAWIFEWVIQLPSAQGHSNVHEHSIGWWEHLSAILLTAILLLFAIMDLKRKFVPLKPSTLNETPDGQFEVSGMHCEGCVNKIERQLGKLGIHDCKVELQNNLLLVWGNFQADQIVESLGELGFQVSRIPSRS